MYQEVALDPRCLGEYHYYGLLRNGFGFEAGRYVIAPVRDWAKEAFQAVKASKTISPVKKKSINNFLNHLQKNRVQSLVLLPKDRTVVRADNWSDWCRLQLDYMPFYSVISELSEVSESTIKYDDVIEGHIKWAFHPSIQINKSADEITHCLSSLLRFGGDLLIVDQYFKLANNTVLKAILSLVQHSHAVNSITLVTSINTHQPANVFKQEYVDIFEYIPTFSLIVAPERYFHDRYVISDKGAIKSGHGFSEGIDKGSQADKLSLSLCGMQEAIDTKCWVKKVVTEQKAEKIILFKKIIEI